MIQSQWFNHIQKWNWALDDELCNEQAMNSWYGLEMKQKTTLKLHKKKHILDEKQAQPVDMHNMCSIFQPIHQSCALRQE